MIIHLSKFDIVAYLTALQLYLPRLLAIFTMVAFFSKSVISGTMIRIGICLSILIMLMPDIINDSLVQQSHIKLSAMQLLPIIIKEAFIGLIFGFIISIPFWILEATGNFIDNQRGGAGAGGSKDQMSGSDSTELGQFLLRIIVVLFYVSGGFLHFVGWVYHSYEIWPVLTYVPTLDINVSYVALEQLDKFFDVVLISCAPIVICMFISELGLGLVNRFAPSLNVFIISMPIKSAVGFLVLILYLPIFINHYLGKQGEVDQIFSTIMRVVQP